MRIRRVFRVRTDVSAGFAVGVTRRLGVYFRTEMFQIDRDHLFRFGEARRLVQRFREIVLNAHRSSVRRRNQGRFVVVGVDDDLRRIVGEQGASSFVEDVSGLDVKNPGDSARRTDILAVGRQIRFRNDVGFRGFLPKDFSGSYIDRLQNRGRHRQ